MNFRKVLSFALGPLGTAALGFITLPILTWYYSADDIGRLSMQQVVTSFSLLLFSLGLDQAFVREFHEEQDKAQLLRATLLPGLGLLALTLPILAFWAAPIASLVFGQADPLLTAMLFVSILATYVTRFLSLILRMQERGLAFSLSQVLPRAFFLMLVGAQVASAVTPSFRALLFATTVSAVIVLLVYGWNTRTELASALWATIDGIKLRQMVAYALPLIASGLAFWGLTAMDRMFLRVYSTLAELATYSVASNFAAGAAILQSVFSTLWAPAVYRWASEGECGDKVGRAVDHVLFVVILIFSLSGMLSWIIPLVLPANFASVQHVFMACLAYPLLYTLSEATSVGIGLLRRTGFAVAASLGALAVDVAMDYLLVPHVGAAGAAVASATAFGVYIVIRTEASARLWQSFPRTKLYVFLTLSMATVIATALVGRAFEPYALAFWFVILCAACAAFRNTLKAASGFVVLAFAR